MKMKVPNTYVIIFALLVLCAVATWFVPGGQYLRGDEGTVSYQSVDAVPKTLQVFTAVYHGFVKQAGIMTSPPVITWPRPSDVRSRMTTLCLPGASPWVSHSIVNWAWPETCGT